MIKLHITFILLRIADILSTYINVKKYGFIVEGNYLPQMLMSKYGFGVFAIINIISASLIWFIFSKLAFYKSVKFALVLFLIINTIIVFSNLLLYLLA